MKSDANPPLSIEAQLEQQTHQFSAVLRTLSDFIYTFDTEGRFLFANPALLDLLGLSLSEIKGKTFFELPYPAALAARLHQQIGLVVQTQAEVRDETPFTSPSGVQGYYEYIFRPIFAAEGQVEVVAGSTRDISERKAAEMALAELSSNLEARVADGIREVRTLAAELTLAEQHERHKLAKTLHDGVQQELYAIQFSLADLKKELAGRHAAEALDDATALLRKTIQLTRDVTVDLGPATLGDPDLRVTLQWLVASMAQKHGLRVKLVAASCEVPNEALRTLLFNLSRELLFNIVKHAEVLEAVFTVKRNQGGLELVVSDEGKGFTPASLDAAQGSGLGLTDAHKRLRLLGGSLTIDSTLGRGTSITVFMPLTSLTLG